MSIIVKEGDTFARISRRVFGVETEAPRIARANPHAKEPLVPGTLIIVPDVDQGGSDTPLSTSNADEISIEIEGERFRFWDTIRINRSMDRFDVVEFTAPNQPDDPYFRKTFRPLSYKPVSVYIGGQRIFTGTMIDITPDVNPASSTLAIVCYSKPAVLEDCTPPASMFDKSASSLEFKNRTLIQICKDLCDPFGIKVESSIKFVETVTSINPPITDELQGFPLNTRSSAFTEEGKPFDLVAIEPTEKIHDFIVKLARRRRLLIANNERGSLVITRSSGVGRPVEKLTQSVPPLVSIQPAFKPREYYSHITALSPVAIGGTELSFTIHSRNAISYKKAHADELAQIRSRRARQLSNDDLDNPRASGFFRPFVYGMSESDSIDSGTEAESAETKMGRMFANCVSYEVQIGTWRDSAGRLWQPNTTIMLESKNAMVYRPFEFLIRTVEFETRGTARTAILTLVLPGGFDGKVPKVLPWD